MYNEEMRVRAKQEEGREAKLAQPVREPSEKKVQPIMFRISFTNRGADIALRARAERINTD